MCNAGIPVLDVYQMTESAPTNDKDAVVTQTAELLTHYFKDHPTTPCVQKSTELYQTTNSTADVKSPTINLNSQNIDMKSPAVSLNSTKVDMNSRALEGNVPAIESKVPVNDAKSFTNNTVGSLFQIFRNERKSNKSLVSPLIAADTK